MRVLKTTVIVFLLVFIGVQFAPIQLNKSNATLKTDFIKTYNPPLEIRNILKVSCYNCHSNNTDYPWYSYIQPAGMFLQSHIDEGKSELNFSEFDDYSSRMKKLKLNSIVNQLEDEEMPLPSYLIIHREAELSTSERELLILFINSLLK